MAYQNTNVSPYYDDYDPTKNYRQILALPGRVEQAREFTQIQTMFLDFLKRLGDTILKNGSIIEGCGLVIQGNQAIIDSGRVYFDGIVYTVPQSSVTITGTGREVIGVKVNEVIITEVEDPTLRDPAQGYDNYNQTGAYRLRTTLEFVLNDSSATPVYTLQDNSLLIQEEKPQLDIISDLLARRTNDESGNYRVNGLTLFSEANENSSVTLTVESGKAYILGYEVTKPTPTKITIPLSTETRTVLNEPKVFTVQGGNTYLLNNSPVHSVDRVVATVQITESTTRGSTPGGIDYLLKSPVVQVISVIQGQTTYVSGEDYQLTSDGIDWSLSGVEPASGSSYSVTYQYNKIMVPTTDYLLTNNTSGYFIDFSPSGDNPVIGTSFSVDYKFYLARKDLVSLQSDGNIKITTGQSNIPRMVSTPSDSSTDTLNLGTIYMPPNSTDAITNSYSITRLNMEELQGIVKRVESMEYNIALDALDEEAMAGEAPTNLKGIFSDGFIGFTKADLFHEDYTAAMSIESGELVLPTSSFSASNLVPDREGSDAEFWGRIVTTPVTEVLAIEQPYATGSMLVNPYNVFNKMAILNLYPAVDNWVDTENITVEKQDTRTHIVHRWWLTGGTLWNDTERMLFNNLILDQGQSWSGWGNITGTLTTNGTAKTILDEAIQYMRQREVNIEASNLIPNADNLEAFFDGVRVNLTAVSPTVAGTSLGTVRADSNGFVKAKFNIPANIRTGTREVVLKNANNTAISSYTANGRKRVVEQTVLRTRVTVQPYDPLAQSFMFDQDKILSAVELYFSAKSSTDNVNIQIRDMVNGYPGQIVYAEKVLSPGEVNTSVNASLATKISFDDPVMCKAGTQYCVVIVTDSDSYQLFVGELGKQDVSSNITVIRQPYLAGTLFSSANALTWTAHQTKDLKFKIYTCTFANSGTVEFEPITGLSIDKVLLMADYLTPSNTGCSWEIKLNNGNYQPIGNFEDKDTNSNVTSVQLRATFSANSNMSPLMALDSFTLAGFLTSQSGVYVSRNVDVDAGYTTVTQIFEANIPSGCTVVSKFSTDNENWITGTLQPSVVVNQDFTRYTYTHTLQGSATDFRAKLEITAPNHFARPRARKFMNILK